MKWIRWHCTPHSALKMRVLVNEIKCTYRLTRPKNLLRMVRWIGCTSLQTQHSKFECWYSKVEHATSWLRSFPQYWLFTNGWRIKVTNKCRSRGTGGTLIDTTKAKLLDHCRRLPGGVRLSNKRDTRPLSQQGWNDVWCWYDVGPT